MPVPCSYTSYILAKTEMGDKETYINHLIANVILISSYGLSSKSEYVEHVRCISTFSLDRNRTLELATDTRKTTNKYCKFICPIRRIKCFGILIGLWNEWPESRGLMPGGSHEFFLCLFVNIGSDVTRPLFQRTSGFYTAVNQSDRAVSNSHLISSRRYKTL